MQRCTLKDSWRGFLSFSLVNRFDKTVVKDKKHFGPLVLQRPYYQEDERPTVLVIHPPGGVVAGDELTTNIILKTKAKAFISTPAATKFYRSIGAKAYQRQQITLEQGVQLEWLPQETLFFNQARVSNHLEFQLNSPDCQLIAWDIVGLGRPAMQEKFEQGEIEQTVTLSLNENPFFIDKFRFDNDPELLTSPFALNNASLMATMIFYHPKIEYLQQLQERLLVQPWAKQCGISLVGKVLLIRSLDTDLEDLKERLIAAWRLSRKTIIGAEPIRPRIWNT